MSHSDNKILELLRKDKQEGLDLLFERFYKPLVVFSDTYVGSIPIAEDIVQEQFIKLWNKKTYKWIVDNALSSYLFTTVKNASINYLEKKDVLSDTVELPHYHIAQEEAMTIDEEGIVVIIEALSRLPERTKVVVEYVMLKDMKYQEAADELGISINTVKSLLKSGMKDLRSLLKDKRDLIFFLYIRKKS